MGIRWPGFLRARLSAVGAPDAGPRRAPTKTLRRRLFALAGRLTRSARRVRLHLPAGWPWAIGWATALARFRAIPLLA